MDSMPHASRGRLMSNVCLAGCPVNKKIVATGNVQGPDASLLSSSGGKMKLGPGWAE